ncbi:MAG: sortase [Actinobacteria bacterium]|nr:sortase [Actinomycetota bacterium]
MTIDTAPPAPVPSAAALEQQHPELSRPVLPEPPRPKKAARPPVVLTPREYALRGIVGIAGALLLTFAFNLLVVSHVQYFANQQQLRDAFQQQLADGVAPVSEGDTNDVLLPDGAPVALLQIPAIGLESVIVEGTSSATTQQGPGHRRDTVLPGQAGTSVIMGRASAFGGPFSRIAQLKPRDTFTVITGQGEQTFAVVGTRYQKDQDLPQLLPGESRLVLETSRGPMPYTPSGMVRVDARLVSEVQDPGPRQTSANMLPLSHRAMATDTSTVWALVFGLQALLALELGLMWAMRRLGKRQIWTVFVPVALLVSLIVTDQVVRLLPNLL